MVLTSESPKWCSATFEMHTGYMSTTSRRISENATVLMHRLDLFQTDLAARVGMARMTLSQRLGGRSEWKANEIEAVAEVLHVSVIELVGTIPDVEEWDRRRTSKSDPSAAASGPRFLVMPDDLYDGVTPGRDRFELSIIGIESRSVQPYCCHDDARTSRPTVELPWTGLR